MSNLDQRKNFISDNNKFKMRFKRIVIDEHYSYDVGNMEKLQWEKVIRQFSDATIYQTWSYGAIRWGKKNLAHFVLYEDGRLLAATQLRIMRLPIIGSGIAYISSGPMWRLRENHNNIKSLQKMIWALKQEYVVKLGLYLRIIPYEILYDQDEITFVFKNEQILADAGVQPYRTLLLNLSPPIDELMANLKKKWRKSLRSGQKMPIEIKEGTGSGLFQVVKKLYGQMHSRKKFSKFYNIEDFEKIQDDLPEDLKLRILIASKGDSPVSAIVWSQIGTTAIIMFSATGDQGLNLNSSYLLRWVMLERLKERGFLFLDQGGIDPVSNPGGYHYKVGFGGQDVRHIGTFSICNSPISLLIVKFGEYLRKYLRKIKNYLKHFNDLTMVKIN